MALATDIERRLFTVDEYHRMVDAGILTENDRVELIRGEIVRMAPIGTRHAGCVAALNHWLVTALVGRALLWPQNPVALPPYSEPEPDIMLVTPRTDFYRTGHPRAHDVLLLVEVADTTIRYDRRVKVPLYAEESIREVWVVDLADEAIHLDRGPEQGTYRHVERLGRDASIAPEAFPDVVLSVAAILG